MNQEIKKKWVDALRSGEYKQGTEHLKKDGCFCCLGVLMDIYKKENGEEWTGEEQKFDGILSTEIVEWSEVESSDPKLFYSEKILPLGRKREITHLNDSKKLSFEQLADLIEQQL